MSFLSKLLSKTTPEPVELPAPDPAVSTPRVDPTALAREEAQALDAALELGDMPAIARWVVEGRATATRQRAAEAITDPERLQELVRATRHGKDKTVHRILANKRDALLEESRQAQRLQAALEETAAGVARHCVQPYAADYGAQLAQLERQWQALRESATPARQAEVDRQLSAAREGFERHQRALETEARQLREVAQATLAERHRLEAEAQAAAATAAEHAQRLEADRVANVARRAAEDARARHLMGLLRQAQAALEHGGSARATRLRESVAEAMQDAPPLPAWFPRQLETLDGRLAELRDWKTFTVVPKRGQLLQQMQALVGADMSPEELAGRIRRLREEWRSLRRGAGAGAEGGPGDEQAAFEAAAQRAFEPCRAHFAQQAEARKLNQARREELLQRLADFEAAQAVEPDWRRIQYVLGEARREWRDYAPVDPEVAEALQTRLHERLDGLRARLDVEYARNVQARKALVARAAALRDPPDTRAAIEIAKELQREWQAVGVTPRGPEQALWSEFRGHCDALFAHSAKQAAEQGAALAASEARALALCVAIEELAGLPGPELREGLPRLDALREEFDALDLPRAAARGLRQRCSRALERCREALHRERSEAAERGWRDIFAVATRVNEYALALAQGQAADVVDELRHSATSALAECAGAPKAGRALLEQRLTTLAAGGLEFDLAANAATMRLLCVRAELAAGLPTPVEDDALRREHQMQRLVASLARGEKPTPAEVEALVLEWLDVIPVDPVLRCGLQDRMERCRGIQGRR